MGQGGGRGNDQRVLHCFNSNIYWVLMLLSPLGYLELKFPLAANDFPDVILTKSLKPGTVLIQEDQEINIFEVPSSRGSPCSIHQN